MVTPALLDYKSINTPYFDFTPATLNRLSCGTCFFEPQKSPTGTNNFSPVRLSVEDHILGHNLSH